MYYLYKQENAESYLDGLELIIIEAFTEDSANIIIKEKGYKDLLKINEQRFIEAIMKDYWWSNYLNKIKVHKLDDSDDLK